MRRAIVVGATRNFIEEVSSVIDAGSTDLGSTMVVFPGRRPRYFVLRSLARRLRSSFIPPRMLSLDGFIDLLFSAQGDQHADQLRDIDAITTLFHLHQKHPSPYGGAHYGHFPAFYPLGRKLFREFEELAEGGVSPSQLHSVILAGGRRELEPVADLFEEFYASVRQRGFTTRAMRYAAVSQAPPPFPDDDIDHVIIAGVHSTTRSVDALLRMVVQHPKVQFMLQEGPECSRTLKALGMEAEYRGGENRRPTVSMAHGTDCHAQVYGASGILRQLLEAGGVPEEETVFVLPEAGTLFPVIHHLLPLYPDGRFNIAMGYPLTRTPVYGFLESLMQLIGRSEDGKIYAPDYLKFCLHPFTKNIRWGDSDDVTRIIFHTIERSFSGAKAKRFFTLEDLEQDSVLMNECAVMLAQAELSADDVKQHLASIHAQTIGTLAHPASVGDAADRVLRILTYISGNSTVHRHWLYATFVSTLTITLTELASSTAGAMTLRSPSEYFRFLRSYLETERVPFLGTPLEGVQVLGLSETDCLSFRRVFLFDANDDILPGSPKHYVISPGVRLALGLPTASDEERAVDQNLSALVNTAEQVYFFYTSKGRREKSRYLERMMWHREQKGERPSPGILQYATRLATVTPDPVEKTGPVLAMLHEMTFSASALDTYLHCGLQFYYRYVLHLQEKEGLTAEIERSDLGIFVHRILADYFRPAVGRVLTEDDVDLRRLRELVDKEFAAAYGDDTIGGRFLMKNQIQRHLRDFMQRYQIPVIAEHHPVLEGLEALWEAAIGPAKYRGFIDRIERRGNALFILDYKTGARTESLRINFRTLHPDDRTTWSKAIGSVQLPLYLLLYHHRTGTPKDAIVPVHLMLGRQTIGPEIERPLVEKGGTEHYLLIENIMMALVEEIRSAHHPFVPTSDVTTYCTRCPFTTICGTRWAEAPQFS